MTKMINALEIPVDIKYINGFSNALYYLFALIMLGCVVQYLVKNKINNLSGIVIKGNLAHNDISSIRNQISSNIYGNYYNIDLLKTKHSFESITWINQAVVKRVYPNQIEVKLSEFKPRAIWGNREDSKLVDDFGLVFEANVDKEEYDLMPQFIGLDGQSKIILDMYKELSIAFEPLQNKVKILELNARGSWIATIDGGAHIELGRGNVADIIERAVKFGNGAEKIVKNLNKNLLDIQYIDLRHSESYAMRIQGLSTLDLSAANLTTKK